MRSKKLISILIIPAMMMSIFLPSGRAFADDYSGGEKPLDELASYVPFQNVKINDSFWSPKIKTDIMVSIPHAIDEITKTTIPNFIEADKAVAGQKHGEVIPLSQGQMVFQDSDLYKTIEAMSNAIAIDSNGDNDIAIKQEYFKEKLNEWIPLIEKAQEPDGYLDTLYIDGYTDNGTSYTLKNRFSNFYNHELYCAGHLMEAAIANYKNTNGNDSRLLNVAVKLADCLDNTFGPSPKRKEVPGHEEVEKGLSKLSELINQIKGKGAGDKYLKLAKFFLDGRGNTSGRQSGYNGGEYSQDNIQVTQIKEAVGHAVRAAYLFTGMADVAELNHDSSYLNALTTVWDNVVNKKMYITGGIGATSGGEAFGANYELPNETAYSETCASIANGQWNKEMSSIYGDAKYVDILEKTLYNNDLAGVSLDGSKFTYTNPLLSEGGYNRSTWFSCACCPPNLMRTIASVGGNIYAKTSSSVYVNLYIGSEANFKVKNTNVKFTQKTDYPWNGDVAITVDPSSSSDFAVKLRIPGWNTGYSVKVNGQDVDKTLDRGYVTINRTWSAGDKIELNLNMDVKRVKADPKVKADVGRAALQRGPMVYCIESAENSADANSYVVKSDVSLKSEYDKDLLGGVTVIKGTAESGKNGLYKSEDFTAIPYYAWDNKTPGNSMTVWINDTEPAAPKPTIASKAKVSTSYCSSWEHLEAINNQKDPANSSDTSNHEYGNWPKTGLQWVQYDFDKAYTINSSDVYWWKDGQGIDLPKSWDLKYWDDSSSTWKDVQAADKDHSLSYGVELDKYNTCTFAPVTTTKLRLEMMSNDKGSSTGILQWKVNGSDVVLESLSITADKSNLNVGDTANLTVSGTMSDKSKADMTKAKVEYSSDNASIAAVNNSGEVTAIKEGTALITAKVTLDSVTLSTSIKITVDDNKSDNDFKIESSSNINKLEPNKMLDVRTTVTNVKGQETSVMAIVALYDSNGKMINMSYLSKKISKGSSETFNAGFKLPSDVTGCKAKIFVWDGTDIESSDMKPLSNVITLTSEGLK